MKKAEDPGTRSLPLKRRGGDSNPRHGRAVYRFSRPARSTTLPPLPRCPAAPGPAGVEPASLAVEAGASNHPNEPNTVAPSSLPATSGCGLPVSAIATRPQHHRVIARQAHPRESSDSVRGHNQASGGTRDPDRGFAVGSPASPPASSPPHGNPAGGTSPQVPVVSCFPAGARIDADAIILQVSACNLFAGRTFNSVTARRPWSCGKVHAEGAGQGTRRP